MVANLGSGDKLSLIMGAGALTAEDVAPGRQKVKTFLKTIE